MIRVIAPALASTRELLEPIDFAPFQVTAGGMQVLLAAGEAANVESAEVHVRVDVPELGVFERRLEAVASTLELPAPRQLASGSSVSKAPAEPLPKRIAFEVTPWSSVPAFGAGVQDRLSVRRSQGSVSLIQRGDGVAARAIRLSTESTPRRVVGIPPIGAEDTDVLEWSKQRGLLPRPSIEPGDPGGWLLMAYLMRGQFGLSVAAARTVERSRGERSTLDWARPSYSQLLVGYSYALGRDTDALLAWCDRTDASRALGADGLVLSAYAAWLVGDTDNLRSSLESLPEAGMPILTLGATLGVSLVKRVRRSWRDQGWHDVDSVAPESGHDELGYLEVILNEWVPTLVDADASVPTVSLASGHQTTTDITGLSLLRRVNHRILFLVSRRFYDYLLGPNDDALVETEHLKGTNMGSVNESHDRAASLSSQGDSSLRLLAIGVCAVWLALVLLLVVAGVLFNKSTESALWLVLPVQTVAAAGLGAWFGVRSQISRVMHAEATAKAAELTSGDFREAATKGRALAAALQSDDQTHSDSSGQAVIADAGIASRHGAIARALFGELVATGRVVN